MDFEKELNDLLSVDETNSDEWIYSKFHDKCRSELTASQAYQNIDVAVEVLLKTKDENNAIMIIEVILTLSRHSDTTEVPKIIEENINHLFEIFDGYCDYAKCKLNELCSWYRIC